MRIKKCPVCGKSETLINVLVDDCSRIQCSGSVLENKWSEKTYPDASWDSVFPSALEGGCGWSEKTYPHSPWEAIFSEEIVRKRADIYVLMEESNDDLCSNRLSAFACALRMAEDPKDYRSAKDMWETCILQTMWASFCWIVKTGNRFNGPDYWNQEALDLIEGFKDLAQHV